MVSRSFAIVGAGFSGAVVARQLAEAGHTATVFDTRNHVAGNCFTKRHESGVMVHVYGPHIFHTQHEHVWDFITRFGVMKSYRHTVSAMSGGKKYQLPMNLTLINDFFGTNFTPEEAEAFITEKADKTITNPVSFEDQALRFVGREMYEAFLRATQKSSGALSQQNCQPAFLLDCHCASLQTIRISIIRSKESQNTDTHQ